MLLFTLIMAIPTSKLHVQNEAEVFPKIKIAIGILHTLIIFTSEEKTTNFKDHYTVGMSKAINIWKTKKKWFLL